MKHSRPPHPFLPDDEQRNRAISVLAVARNDGKIPTTKTELTHHTATYRRVGTHVVHIVYTPNHTRNQTSCDRIVLGVVR